MDGVPDGHLKRTFTYDAQGFVDEVTDARGHALDSTCTPWGGLAAILHYDSEAEADAQQNLRRTVSYTHDLNANLRSTSDSERPTAAPAGANPALEPADRLYTFTYDALDRVEETIAHYLPGGATRLTSGYDRFGNRSALELADGGPGSPLAHTWSFDALDRLTEASLPGSAAALGFQYFPNDDLEILTHGNAATTSYRYHPEGPVDTITVRDASAAQLHHLDYAVDALLNVDTISEAWDSGMGPWGFDYGYDEVSRLTSAQYPSLLTLPASDSFGYDAAGNRDDDPGVASPWAYNANNQIEASPSSAGGADLTYTFDADGNVATRSDGITYTYDRTNRLRTWTDGTTTASYQYDPFGRRIRKTVSGVTTWFLWDGDELLAEYDAAGTRQARYAYAGGFAPVQLATPDGTGGEEVFDVHTDSLDTPRMLTDAAGEPVWRAVYEAFGRAHVDPDPDGDGTSVPFNVRFPGQYADAETGLSYNRFRYYEPEIGRYISARIRSGSSATSTSTAMSAATR